MKHELRALLTSNLESTQRVALADIIKERNTFLSPDRMSTPHFRDIYRVEWEAKLQVALSECERTSSILNLRGKLLDLNARHYEYSPLLIELINCWDHVLDNRHLLSPYHKIESEGSSCHCVIS